jgi:hypothetical protein
MILNTFHLINGNDSDLMVDHPSIDQKIISKIESIFQYYPIEFGYIFGSIISNIRTPLSDIDLAIYLDQSIDDYKRHRTKLMLLVRLEELFSSSKVDLVVLNDSPLLISEQIIRTGVGIFIQNPKLKQKYEEDIMKYSLDFKVFAQQYNEWQVKAVQGINPND